MGTRLYPRTEDSTVLERLAEGPAGTHERLKRFEAITEALSNEQLLGLTGEDRHSAIYQLRELQPHVETLHTFLVFGWGRLEGRHLLTENQAACGAARDLALVRQLLQAQGVTLPEGVTTAQLEGLVWS